MRQEVEKTYLSFEGKWLGTVDFNAPSFPKEALKEIESSDFERLSVYDKHDRIARSLLRAIQNAPEGSFVLPQVVGFLSKVREKYPSYNFASFEFFLNYFTEISDEEKIKLRGKIAGRYIPRQEYQIFFPIGGGSFLPGPHFVVAHFSPDLDTTVASFIGFLDAFAAKVAHGRHYWVVPGGPPSGSVEIEILFRKAIGKECFEVLSQRRRALSLSSMDLLTQHNLIRKRLMDLSYGIHHERTTSGVIVVDDDGHYIADWRNADFDIIRAIIGRFVGMLREHVNYFHTELISLFAQKELMKENVSTLIAQTMQKKLSDCSIGKELTDDHRGELDRFLKEILDVKEGVVVTYREFLESQSSSSSFRNLLESIESLTHTDLFTEEGKLIDDRSLVLKHIETIFKQQMRAHHDFFRYLDTLEVAIRIKQEVLGHEATHLTHMDYYDNIMDEMEGYANLTVTYDEGGKKYPLGTIEAIQLKKRPLATMSMRDFSNFQETEKPEYIEVASVVDHHKTDIETAKPFISLSGDCQSSNTLIAKYSMNINDRYSTGNMTLEAVDAQIQEVSKKLQSASHIRILERLLKKKQLLQNTKNSYYVSSDREFLEYYQALHAILDDTDLLTKVTELDVGVVAMLINRLKSLMIKQEIEIVHFDELSKDDPEFAKKAAKKLLQSHDLYSIYSLTYRVKENTIDQLIKATAKRENTYFFQDTKVLSKYAVIGQFKCFIKNLPILTKKVGDIRKLWLSRSKETFASNSELTLHIFMLSSVLSAEELFADIPDKAEYKDEVWLWIPPKDKRCLYQLKEFLRDFLQIPALKNQDLEVEIYDHGTGYEKAFLDAGFPKQGKKKVHKSDLSFAILRVPPRSVVSRKSQVATCL